MPAITASSSTGFREHVEYTRRPPTSNRSRPRFRILAWILQQAYNSCKGVKFISFVKWSWKVNTCTLYHYLSYNTMNKTLLYFSAIQRDGKQLHVQHWMELQLCLTYSSYINRQILINPLPQLLMEVKRKVSIEELNRCWSESIESKIQTSWRDTVRVKLLPM